MSFRAAEWVCGVTGKLKNEKLMKSFLWQVIKLHAALRPCPLLRSLTAHTCMGLSFVHFVAES